MGEAVAATMGDGRDTMEAAASTLARLDRHHIGMTLEEYEDQALELEDRLAPMTDEEVVKEYKKTDGCPATLGRVG